MSDAAIFLMVIIEISINPCHRKDGSNRKRVGMVADVLNHVRRTFTCHEAVRRGTTSHVHNCVPWAYVFGAFFSRLRSTISRLMVSRQGSSNGSHWSIYFCPGERIVAFNQTCTIRGVVETPFGALRETRLVTYSSIPRDVSRFKSTASFPKAPKKRAWRTECAELGRIRRTRRRRQRRRRKIRSDFEGAFFFFFFFNLLCTTNPSPEY